MSIIITNIIIIIIIIIIFNIIYRKCKSGAQNNPTVCQQLNPCRMEPPVARGPFLERPGNLSGPKSNS